MTARHLLILGGTGEAAALARGALARFGENLTVTTALAGRTRHPGPIPGEVRIGGFGGPGGGSASSSAITSWVEQTFTATTIGGVTVYDLTATT